jgi:hypothetical protein
MSPESLIAESPNSSPHYTQDEIAAMVGSAREVVQRALSRRWSIKVAP